MLASRRQAVRLTQAVTRHVESLCTCMHTLPALIRAARVAFRHQLWGAHLRGRKYAAIKATSGGASLPIAAALTWMKQHRACLHTSPMGAAPRASSQAGRSTTWGCKQGLQVGKEHVVMQGGRCINRNVAARRASAPASPNLCHTSHDLVLTTCAHAHVLIQRTNTHACGTLPV